MSQLQAFYFRPEVLFVTRSRWRMILSIDRLDDALIGPDTSVRRIRD
jgi:hypothetical protein